MRKWVQLVLLALGASLCVMGAVTTFLWPKLFEALVNMQLQLTTSSKSFEIWRDTPVPMSLKVYFFNWTNPEKLKTSEKPNFVEMGPYSFDEFHEKVNIKFHDNHTVTFQQIKRWKFNPEQSNGSLHDMVTVLNVPPLTAAYVTRNWGFFVQTSLSYFMGRFEKMAVTKEVRELLFDGYTDPLISVADTLPALANVDIPFDKFGWFYTRNGSDTYDGIFNMDTGSDDINKLGTLREWNYRNRTNYYEDHCGEIVGSAGELWPPHRSKDFISMFSSDLCRSIDLPYEEETVSVGIPAYRYVGGRGLVDNGTLDKRNECYCGGECMPIGVANASTCRYGSPAFVSYPHFLNADPYYSSLINGMNPDPKKHSFYITVEPNTGIPIDVAARLQINILMQPSKNIGMYQKVPKALFPMIWFEQTARMTPEMASSLSQLLGFAQWGVYTCVAILVIGILLMAFVAFSYAANRLHLNNTLKMRKGDKMPQSGTLDLNKPLMTRSYLNGGNLDMAPLTPSRRAPVAEPEDSADYGDPRFQTSEIGISRREPGQQNGLYPLLTSPAVS